MSTPADQVTPDVEDALDRTIGVDTSSSRTPEAAPEAPESGADEPAGITAGGRTFADTDELRKAYEEAQQLISSTRPQAVDEEPEYIDPLSYLPPSQDQAVANQLIGYAQQNAREAAEFVWENQDDPRIGPELQDMIINNWAAQNPAAWARFQHAHYQEVAAQIADAQTTGIRQQQVDAVAQSAEATIRAELGDLYEEYEPKINEMIQNGDFIQPRDGFPNGIPTEAALTAIVRECVQRAWMRDHWDELQKPAAKPNPQAATTQTKSAASGPKDDVDAALDRVFS